MKLKNELITLGGGKRLNRLWLDSSGCFFLWSHGTFSQLTHGCDRELVQWGVVQPSAAGGANKPFCLQPAQGLSVALGACGAFHGEQLRRICTRDVRYSFLNQVGVIHGDAMWPISIKPNVAKSRTLGCEAECPFNGRPLTVDLAVGCTMARSSGEHRFEVL